MIWLLAYPLPSYISTLDRGHTGRLRKRENLLTVERGDGSCAEKPNHTEESLVLYKSFNTLWMSLLPAWILRCSLYR
jgi:hypothetical protein